MDILSLAWLERSVFAAGQTFVPGIQWSQEIAKGGWVMVTLGIMSVLGLAVAFERLFHFACEEHRTQGTHCCGLATAVRICD